jgi:hypothetical protein
VPEVVPRAVVTEAYTWVGVMVFAGIAIGSTLSGVLVDSGGGRAGLLAAITAAACALLITVLGGRVLAPPVRAANARLAESPD